MIILGIDTAIRCTGYGVIQLDKMSDIKVLDCGIIKNTQKMKHSECLRRISGGIKELVDHFKPNSASIEDAFYGKNIKTSMILSMARGAAIAAVSEYKLPVFTYSPRSAKKAIVGTGKGSKAQIALMLANLLGINTIDIPLDSTDALALAICHGQNKIRPELSTFLTNEI